MERTLDPRRLGGHPTPAEAPPPPRTSLHEKTPAALRQDSCLIEGFGRNFVDYYLRIKEAEIVRFQSEATDWEQKEYFRAVPVPRTRSSHTCAASRDAL